MAALYLGGAILVEIVATTCLKYSEGFTKLWPSVGTAVGYAAAFVLLAQALKTMEVSVAYAIWSGLGTALVTLVGVALLDEALTAAKVAGVMLVIAGVIVLNLGGAGAH